MLASLYGFYERTAAMPCIPVTQVTHREKDPDTPLLKSVAGACAPTGTDPGWNGGIYQPFFVHSLLNWKQTRSDPQAIEAVRAEVDALAAVGTWDTENVYPKAQLIQWAKDTGTKIFIGEGLQLCSIKNSELPITDKRRKYKGRYCYRTPTARDQDGAIAIFQEMGSRPTTIVSLNISIAYGSLPGHSMTVADAIKAYVQSLLVTDTPTYLELEKNLMPKKFQHIEKPCCLLIRALYGHPEAGAHWENHLTKIVTDMGGTPVQGHPSVFWFESKQLMLIVYVDDLLLSGPTCNHASFWTELRFKVDTDEPEPIDRYLGRHHSFGEFPKLEHNLMEWFASPHKV